MQDLRRRPTLNELTTYLQVGQPKIKYPDRTATRLRNSHYLMQFDGHLLNIEEQEKTIEKNKLAQNELNRISQINPNTPFIGTAPFQTFIGTEEDPEVIESYGVEQEISGRKRKSAESMKEMVKSDLEKIKEEEPFVKKLSKKAQKAEDRSDKAEVKKLKSEEKAKIKAEEKAKTAEIAQTKKIKAESIAKIKTESKELEKQIKAESKAKALKIAESKEIKAAAAARREEAKQMKAKAKAEKREEAKELRTAVAEIKEAEKIEAKQVMAAVKIAEAQKTPPKGLITDKSVSQWRMMTKDTIKEQLELRGVFFNRVQVEGLDTTERGVTKKNKKMTKEDYLRELFKVL